MSTKAIKSNRWSLERKFLVTFLVILLGVVSCAWVYAFKLRQTIATQNAGLNVDTRALIEVERLRNIVESQMADSRSFFLLGSKALFDKQKSERQALTEGLNNFEKQYSLPQVPELLKKIETLAQQQDEVFDQAQEFREKQTESKIVGQFYQSKIVPIRAKINDALDEIIKIHNVELDHSRAKAREAALSAEDQIPRGMIWLTGLVSALFFGMALLVIRMLRERSRQLAERDRLYSEAKKAVQDRDEVISAVSQDLKDPLHTISEAANTLAQSAEKETAEVIKSSLETVDGLIKDIVDQKKSDMNQMTLRLDQLSIDLVLDDARLMLQPLAKQRDVRLQFDSVNPPVMAFFDRERVLRILSNLIGNAIKFSPKHSRIVIKVRSDQQFVYVSVVDTGPGIPESQLPEIFENFWQARKTAEQGAGVGLAIVKTIVEAHGGTVKVDSRTGFGSTFTFSLPRRRPVGAQLKRPAAPVIRHGQRVPPIEFQ